MPTKGHRTSAATRRRVERSAGALSTAAIRRMETNHDWYRAMPAENRSWVNLVAQAGHRARSSSGSATPDGARRRSAPTCSAPPRAS